ncbi:MAG: DUF952 domain-containing protein [Waddliaceae bacterium]|jgi:uncharacterized protein (DUF952 family)|nr:DUF952 domain-containing protein [Waddliaceae bacterium]MBT4444809.1 DUF952 domain-containing protein [Waddliaceae bacterium]MBT6928484.1 DUF952 domain-containing protein [Waddliaceae bacterium]MBT7264363.1 DUF952 domain-containing protein [Waddliaceae bacterium]
MNESGFKVPLYLYKVVTADHWKEISERKEFILTSDDKKFIHLSEEHQLGNVVEKFFAGQNVVVLKIDRDKLKGRLEHESNPGGKNKYFHLYEGCIPFDAIRILESQQT